MSEDVTLDLLARWRRGDQRAADALFERYADQMVTVARGRLSARLAQRLDPEDVVQSAFRSFFIGTREGRYDIHRGGDLWRLLVGITLHKVQHQVRRNRAGKRSVSRECPLGDEGDAPFDVQEHVALHAPSPLEALALFDEVERFLGLLKPPQRRVLELRLQGYNRRPKGWAVVDRPGPTIPDLMPRRSRGPAPGGEARDSAWVRGPVPARGTARPAIRAPSPRTATPARTARPRPAPTR